LQTFFTQTKPIRENNSVEGKSIWFSDIARYLLYG